MYSKITMAGLGHHIGPCTRKSKVLPTESSSLDTFASVYGPQLPSTSFSLQPLPTIFHRHYTH